MQNFLKKCLKVNGVREYHPIHDYISTHPLEPKPEMIKKYGWNNGKVAFVTEDGSYYVTPFCFEAVEVLEKLGYTNGSIYVPFSNGEVPSDVALAEQWSELCIISRRLDAEKEEKERQEKYKRISAEKRLEELPKEVYQMCILIPKAGIETTRMGSENGRTYPISDWQVPECIGTYYQNNGKVSFVDSHGQMYVTPFCYEVTKLLQAAGYEERGLYVPFSNGEKPADSVLAARWLIMCSESDELFDKRAEMEKQERYKKLAEQKRLEELPEEVYQMSMLIPKGGIQTIYWDQEISELHPVSDWQIPECMGTYCQNNGRVAFVDSQGQMYVTPFCSEVKRLLKACGYEERSLFVPFSNGEKPADALLAAKWVVLCDDAQQFVSPVSNDGQGFKL